MGMIGTGNYFDEIRKIGIEKLPDALQKGHELIVKSTNNGETWSSYESNPTIKKVIDLYFDKLNGYLSTQSTKPTVSPLPEYPVSPTERQTKRRSTGASSSNADRLKSNLRTKQKSTAKRPQGKPVERIREEIRFIKRYVGLHNKIKSPPAILSFIKSLQRSMIQKIIRKTSPLAKDIQLIQDKLVNLYNVMKGEKRIELNEKDLNRLVGIAGGERVYPSVGIIKRYIGIQGKDLEHKKIELFKKQIENALQQGKVGVDDPYRDKVQAIHNSIKKLKAGNLVQIGKAELNGLEGIMKACGCKPGLGKIYKTGGRKLRSCNKRSYSDSKSKGACSHNKGLSGVLTAEEMATRTFETLELTGNYFALIGKPAKNFTMMLHGEPNAGKTTFLLKFAKHLAERFGRVIYISSEEFAASTMTTKVKELLTPFPPNLFFYENVTDIDLAEYDFIILDSVNDLGLRLQDFKALRKKHPKAAFIIILQHTKDGTYRGGKDWEHEVEIAGEVTNGTVAIYRNRYGVKGTMNFFDNTTTSYQQLNNYTLKPY